MNRDKTQVWYGQIRKPAWAPPARWFGPVWSVLYIIIALTYAWVAYLYLAGSVPFAVVVPFALNLVANLIYAPIQFRLRNYTLATFDILLVLGTLVWELFAIYPYAPIVALANTPYLAWVCFATLLQFAISYLNR